VDGALGAKAEVDGPPCAEAPNAGVTCAFPKEVCPKVVVVALEAPSPNADGCPENAENPLGAAPEAPNADFSEAPPKPPPPPKAPDAGLIKDD